MFTSCEEKKRKDIKGRGRVRKREGLEGLTLLLFMSRRKIRKKK